MNKRILKLALPNIISNITIPLLGMVDLILMGHLDSSDFIGAIALGGMIFNFIYWSFSFLRMGTSGFTAQAFGKGDDAESMSVLSRAMLIAIISGILLILLKQPIQWISFYLLDAETNVELVAVLYYKIRIWAAPASLGLYVIYGWFIGMQDAKTPMIIAITVNILNIALSAYLVISLQMNAEGVALGTVIAQYLGLVMGFFFIYRNYRHKLGYLITDNLLSFRKLKKFMGVNQDIFIRTMLLLFVFTFFTAESARIDKLYSGSVPFLAVNTVLLQFFMFYAFFVDGFAYAAEALAGRYVGAKDEIRLTRVIQLLFN